MMTQCSLTERTFSCHSCCSTSLASTKMRGVALLTLLALASSLKDTSDCEVCLKVLGEIEAKLPSKSDLVATEKAIDAHCKKPPSDKEGKLCYFIDPIKREISQPMKNGVPVAKICEKLKKKSSEICSLRFSSAGTTKSEDVADFAKLRVPQLKTIMADKGIKCPDCIEKGDFVRVLEAARGRGEL